MTEASVSFVGCVSSRVWPYPSSRIWPHFREGVDGELWVNSYRSAVGYAAHSGITSGFGVLGRRPPQAPPDWLDHPTNAVPTPRGPSHRGSSGGAAGDLSGSPRARRPQADLERP